VLRLVLVVLVIVPGTLWYGLKVLWASYRQAPGYRKVCLEAPRTWSNLILRAAGARVELEGEEVLDPDRPQILVANHVSWFDVLALCAYVPGQVVFIAKKEIEGVPFFGRAARATGQIFIDRADSARARASLDAARDVLEKESPTIIMFPEGTRSASGELQPFKKGAFVLAIQAGVDVVPAAIAGSREIMRKGSLLIRPGTIRVKFGEPISVDGLGHEDRNQLTDRARQSLVSLQASAP
jgi:1-acyl-sn-glycerol-3-phosphate acyltransferase